MQTPGCVSNKETSCHQRTKSKKKRTNRDDFFWHTAKPLCVFPCSYMCVCVHLCPKLTFFFFFFFFLDCVCTSTRVTTRWLIPSHLSLSNRLWYHSVSSESSRDWSEMLSTAGHYQYRDLNVFADKVWSCSKLLARIQLLHNVTKSLSLTFCFVLLWAMSRTRNPHLPLFPDLVIQREVVSHPRIKTSHLIVSEWRIKKKN